MQLAEIRDLDGPNVFILAPAVKLEIILDSEESEATLAGRIDSASNDLVRATTTWLTARYAEVSLEPPAVVVRRLDDHDHLAIAWTWEHRAFAMALARNLFAILAGDPSRSVALPDPPFPQDLDDRPSMVRDRERTAIAIGVTGTNGKTTTTRLIAHIARQAGNCTGWNSSSGIYIDGVELEAGDYSGPSGARTILRNPDVQVAVLETARGGILLRGLGYESNDVSVFTNISPDHLDLQGVRTVETLATTKAVVCRVTKPDGTVIVNADDPVVRKATEDLPAPRTWFTRQFDSDVVRVLREGGATVFAYRHEAIEHWVGNQQRERYPLAAIPITFGGRAVHMIENAMCAIAASLAIGLTPNQVSSALATFSNDLEHNPGRLNIFEVEGVTVVLDFAHNEAGLDLLIDFARSGMAEDARLISIIGTAGDRTDTSLFEIGRVAAERSEVVIAKGTTHYLRGRSLESLMERYRSGAQAGNVRAYVESENEMTATREALTMARRGDCVIIMAQEHIAEIQDHLAQLQTSG